MVKIIDSFTLWYLVWLGVLIGFEFYLARLKSWPPGCRWWAGWVSLFGTGLGATLIGGWHWPTWAVLAGGSVATYWLLPVGFLRRREAFCWTVYYSSGFSLALPFILAGWLNEITWVRLLLALGLCGAIKVGASGWLDSREAARLRKAGKIDVEFGIKNSYRNQTTRD